MTFCHLCHITYLLVHHAVRSLLNYTYITITTFDHCILLSLLALTDGANYFHPGFVGVDFLDVDLNKSYFLDEHFRGVITCRRDIFAMD